METGEHRNVFRCNDQGQLIEIEMDCYATGTFTGQLNLTPSNLITHPIFKHVTRLKIFLQPDLHVNVDIESIANAFPHLAYFEIRWTPTRKYE